jgi:ketosteroid isomerase-like protein
MYAMIVERIVRNGFRQLSSGHPAAVLKLFAEDAELRFPGQHALGGHWRGRVAITAWFERLLHTLPGIRFDIHDVHVRGMPWNTRVLTRFTDTVPMTDGPPVVNHGVQYLKLRWGRITEDVLYLDTQVVADACVRAGRQV